MKNTKYEITNECKNLENKIINIVSMSFNNKEKTTKLLKLAINFHKEYMYILFEKQNV